MRSKLLNNSIIWTCNFCVLSNGSLCRVLSVEPLSNRVEATLKTGNKAETVKSIADTIVNLHVGDIVTGHIRRIESYGLFITLDKANVVRFFLFISYH